jgi:hypothetical protein
MAEPRGTNAKKIDQTMNHIYIDESGDLGMGGKGSEYFVLAAVKMDDDANKDYCRIPKKIRQRPLGVRTKKISELKFSNSSVLIREMFLTRVARLDLEIYAVVIRKEYTQQKLRENLPILYNYLIKILLEKVLGGINVTEKLTICLDKCMSASQRENFEGYINTEFLALFKALPDMTICHENSYNNQGLIVTDFVCGAFGYKYNSKRQDSDLYTNIIRGRIRAEKTDLFKKK